MPAPGGIYNRDAITQPTECPSWQADGVAEKLRYGFGLVLDCLNEGYRQGMLDHMPGQGDPDALAFIGNDRQIPRGFVEGDAAYAGRLQQAFDMWATAGNAWSVLRNLLGFVSPFLPIWRTVTSNGIWDSMNDATAPVTGTPTWRVYASPSNWNWDGSNIGGLGVLAYWRFFTVVYPPASLWSACPAWGSAGLQWGQYSGSWGLTASVGQVQAMQKIVRIFKRAGAWCHWMIVSFDSTLFPPLATLPSAKLPDGTWGPWSKSVNGQRVPSRAANARYCDGVT